jgi:aryl-alcohol dehydrogenase-like predicted oxidoreductase
MMVHQAELLKRSIEHTEIPGTELKISRVTLGAWAIGGWMWGGTDEAEFVSTILAAPDHGINVIDTAPVYGFGRTQRYCAVARTPNLLR